jgi:hypothetical protein|tara:strand:- start:136 stop:324 length:189 start_codon:yes stop_codon:yes gene_type:complete
MSPYNPGQVGNVVMHVKSLNFGYRADLMTNSVALSLSLTISLSLTLTCILALTLTLRLTPKT